MVEGGPTTASSTAHGDGRRDAEMTVGARRSSVGAPVLAVYSEDEALELVNDTRTGWYNAVYTVCPARAVVRRARPLGDGARERLHLPRRGPRALGGVGASGMGGARGARRTSRVHRAPLDLVRAPRSSTRTSGRPRRPDGGPAPPEPLPQAAAEGGHERGLLEQGGWPDYERARSAHPDYELTPGCMGWDPNVRDGPGDYPIDDSESDITALMWNGVGGARGVRGALAAQHASELPREVADGWATTGRSATRSSSPTTAGRKGLGGIAGWPTTRLPAREGPAAWPRCR